MGRDAQIHFLREMPRLLQQMRQETICVFVLIAVEAYGQLFIQDLVEKSAASPPSATVRHRRKRPLRCPGPVSREWWSGTKILPRIGSMSHSCNIGTCVCNSVLRAKGEDDWITNSV